MGLRVRALQLPEERDSLLAVLQRNLGGLDHRKRYQWLYHDNPAGPGFAWGVFRERSDTPVGVATLVPVYLWIGGQRILCGRVEDFAVDLAHRSLGPAVALQRATFAPIDDGSMALCYDTPPHAAGMATFRRLGMSASAAVYRYVVLARTAPWLQERFGLPAGIALLCGSVLDLALRAGWRHPRGVDIAEHLGAFGDEFTELDAIVGANSRVVRGSRSAKELTWLYRQEPLRTYQILTARREGELIGWAVYSVTDSKLDLVDWLDVSGTRAFKGLLAAVAARGTRTGKLRWQTLATTQTPTSTVLRRMGFHRREQACSVVAYSGRRQLQDIRDGWLLRGLDVRA
jgi:hypothetical protein